MPTEVTKKQQEEFIKRLQLLAIPIEQAKDDAQKQGALPREERQLVVYIPELHALAPISIQEFREYFLCPQYPERALIDWCYRTTDITNAYLYWSIRSGATEPDYD